MEVLHISPEILKKNQSPFIKNFFQLNRCKGTQYAVIQDQTTRKNAEGKVFFITNLIKSLFQFKKVELVIKEINETIPGFLLAYPKYQYIILKYKLMMLFESKKLRECEFFLNFTMKEFIQKHSKNPILSLEYYLYVLKTSSFEREKILKIDLKAYLDRLVSKLEKDVYSFLLPNETKSKCKIENDDEFIYDPEDELFSNIRRAIAESYTTQTQKKDIISYLANYNKDFGFGRIGEEVKCNIETFKNFANRGDQLNKANFNHFKNEVKWNTANKFLCTEELSMPFVSDEKTIETCGPGFQNFPNNSKINLQSPVNSSCIDKTAMSQSYINSSTHTFLYKEYVPKIYQKDEETRAKVNYLKEYKPRYLKRENLEKKVTRAFKKFLVEAYKRNILDITSAINPFWLDFINKNLLPPMTYESNTEKITFKSFNTNYLVWLYNKEGARTLYRKFMAMKKKEVYEVILDSLKEIAETKENKEKELVKAMEYVTSLADNYFNPVIVEVSTSKSNTCESSFCCSKKTLSKATTSSSIQTISIPSQPQIKPLNSYSNKPYEEYLDLLNEYNFEQIDDLFRPIIPSQYDLGELNEPCKLSEENHKTFKTFGADIMIVDDYLREVDKNYME